MNKYFYVLIFAFLLGTTAYGEETVKSVISNADQLIQDRQYLSAYGVLNDKDPGHLDPAVTVKMVEVATKYFSKSIMHEMFSFNNLEPGDDLQKIRTSGGSSKMYQLKVGEVLGRLIDQYPDNADLYYTLGCYYFDVYLKYSNQWLKSSDELLKLTRQYLLEAEKMKKFDDISLYDIGMTYLFNKNTGDAVPYLLKSLKINGKNPDASYNLSFTYYQTKDYNNAVKYSLMSFENYADNFYKGDALRITANSYINLGDYGNALSCFDKAIGFNPKDYFSYDGKLNVFLKQKKYDDALSLCEAAFTAMPDYPEVTGFINRTYLQIKRYDDLEKFYADMLPKFENNDAASGNLKLYLGIYYSKMNRKEEARKAFNDSRERFRKVYKENHEVFGVINQWLKSLD